jgi:hypothetical protein
MPGLALRAAMGRSFCSRPGRRRRSGPDRAPAHILEALENRVLLKSVFAPVFGAETQKQDNGATVSSPSIDVIFWGSFWGGPGSAQSEAIRSAIETMAGSTYFNIVDQYGANSSGMFLNDTRFNTSEPNSSGITGQNIDDVVQDQIDNHGLPEPDDESHTQLYLVVTPPGIGESGQPNVGGFNQVGSDYDFPFDSDSIGEMWVSTFTGGSDPAGLGFNMDGFTSLFGHELAEIMTDFGGGGFKVNTPTAWGNTMLGGDDQIGDKEGNAYPYRMFNGINVQPLWSRADNAWVVDDGLAHTWNFTGNWNMSNPQFPFLQSNGKFALTLNGDQLAPITNDDLVALNGDAKGGVVVYFDGDVMDFDPGYLSGITLNLGAGTNTVELDSALPSGVTLSMNAHNPSGQLTLLGPNANTTWTLNDSNGAGTISVAGSGTPYSFRDATLLVGGTAGDTFRFINTSFPGHIDGGGGNDTIDLSQIAPGLAPTVDLQHQTIPLILNNGFTTINRIIGNASTTDTLLGPDTGQTWQITGPGSGTVAGYQFFGFSNLTGGAGDDTFAFQPGGSVPAITLSNGVLVGGNVDGGGGTNTLDYSALVGPVTVDFTTHTATGIGGTFADIQDVVGSQSPNDTIIGPDAAWVIDGTNSGTIDAGLPDAVTFSSFENLTGSGPANTFTFEPGGSVTGTLTGSPGGANTLDFSALPGPVSINFADGSAPGLIGAFTGITNVVSGPGGLNVAGPDTPTTWTITGPNTVSAFGFTFTNTPSITGGAANDTFQFLPGGSLSGKLDGGGGNNTLDDSQVPTNVMVDLAGHVATGIGQGIFNVQNVTGGRADNLLIGDANANTLVGGLGDNLLIGDTTIWDNNLTALTAIFAEWTRTDQSFNKRISDLINNGGHGLNGSYTLTKKTVMPDNATDMLVAGAGRNWFFQTKGQDILFGEDDNKDRVTTL